mgnify:FL=1
MAESTQELIEKLERFDTRHAAREALRDRLDDAAPALLDVVRDSERPNNMRWAAITLLGEARFEDAGPELVRIMKEEQNLRPDAMRALQAITGRDDVGVEADDWERVISGDAVSEAPDEELSEDDAATFLREALR